MDFFKIVTVLIFLIQLFVSAIFGQLNIIRDVIQFNVAGLPLVHKVANYEFDPDISLKRRKQFRELHGDKAEKYIERIGLGIDGKEEERRIEQQIRDERLSNLVQNENRYNSNNNNYNDYGGYK